MTVLIIKQRIFALQILQKTQGLEPCTFQLLLDAQSPFHVATAVTNIRTTNVRSTNFVTKNFGNSKLLQNDKPSILTNLVIDKPRSRQSSESINLVIHKPRSRQSSESINLVIDKPRSRPSSESINLRNSQSESTNLGKTNYSKPAFFGRMFQNVLYTSNLIYGIQPKNIYV